MSAYDWIFLASTYSLLALLLTSIFAMECNGKRDGFWGRHPKLVIPGGFAWPVLFVFGVVWLVVMVAVSSFDEITKSQRR